MNLKIHVGYNNYITSDKLLNCQCIYSPKTACSCIFKHIMLNITGTHLYSLEYYFYLLILRIYHLQT